MNIQVITLFPEIMQGFFEASMMYKAQDKGIAKLECVDLRQFGKGPRKTVDDTPYGGGDGMLLMVEALFKAVEFCKQKSSEAKVLIMTPRGYDYKQKDAEIFADKADDLIIICGRYEGYDERIITLVDHQICIGPYVLTGGEIPAMVIIDSIVRLLPGVLGGETSAEKESYNDGESIEYPQYTRPEDFNGLKVPEVLLSGNHAEIAKWRKKQSDTITSNKNNRR